MQFGNGDITTPEQAKEAFERYSVDAVMVGRATFGRPWIFKEYNDYVIPNTIVEDGQCDTNYFQHQPYLDNFNEEKGTHLVTVAGIHVEPMGIYGGKQDSLAPIVG